MTDPLRNYNICPNRDCFVEFGYDAPEFNDAGMPVTSEDLLHVHRTDNGNVIDPWWRKVER